MTEYEKYFFDVNGYIIVEDILSAKQLRALNEAIDHNPDRIRLRQGELSLSRNSPALEGTHGRGDISGILNWPKPWCQPFRDLLSHPPALRYMFELIGKGFRYGNANGISMTTGAEGCVLHGGGTAPNQHFYRYQNGKMWNNLMGVCYQLADINPGDGGFACIPGSHKANYDCPPDVLTLEHEIGCLKHLPIESRLGLDLHRSPDPRHLALEGATRTPHPAVSLRRRPLCQRPGDEPPRAVRPFHGRVDPAAAGPYGAPLQPRPPRYRRPARRGGKNGNTPIARNRPTNKGACCLFAGIRI